MREWLELLPINVGHGNHIIPYRVVAILKAQSLPVRRLRDEAKNTGKLLDATEGRKTRSVIVFSSGHVLLSSNSIDTITERWSESLKQRPIL